MNRRLMLAGLVLTGLAVTPTILSAEETARPPELEKVEKKKKVGYLGVYPYGRPVDAVLKQHLKLEHGYVLSKLVSGGPAEKAGLKPNDIILTFNGEIVKSFETLAKAVSGCEAGQEVEVVYLHGGEKKTAKVKLGERPEAAQVIQPWGGGFENELEKALEEEVERHKKKLRDGADENLAEQSDVIEEFEELAGIGRAFEHLPESLEVSLGEGEGRLRMQKFDVGILMSVDKNGKKLYSALTKEGKVLLENVDEERIRKLGKNWKKAVARFLRDKKKEEKKAEKKR